MKFRMNQPDLPVTDELLRRIMDNLALANKDSTKAGWASNLYFLVVELDQQLSKGAMFPRKWITQENREFSPYGIVRRSKN